MSTKAVAVVHVFLLAIADLIVDTPRFGFCLEDGTAQLLVLSQPLQELQDFFKDCGKIVEADVC